MALQSPFFGKRDNEPTSLRHGSPNPNPYANGASPAGAGSAAVSAQAAPVAANTASAGSSAREGGSKLTVGPNIKLKGVEITDCDTLVVEGLVEATMDSRVIQIAERGAFKGSAEIDIAEIHGEFDGNLTVRQKLVIEEGGQLAGEILFGAVAGTKAALSSKPGLQVA